MATTLCYKLAGPTVGMSVTASSHAAVVLTEFDNANANAVIVCNTSSTVPVYINIVSGNDSNGNPLVAPAATIPGDGTAGSFPILTYQSTPINCGYGPLSVTAIGGAAGPTLVTFTPITLF